MNFNSSSKVLNPHKLAWCGMALFSAAALDLATIVCFFLLQLIRFSHRKVQYPVVFLA